MFSDHLSAPFRIFYDITYDCNLRCKHCFTSSGNKDADELTLDEKLNLIENIKKLGTKRISIAGGEPFVSPDLFPFLRICNENNIDVSITTNGTLFTKEIIETLNEYNLKNLTVSFDGGTRYHMDEIRGKGTYDNVIKGLSLLNNYYVGNYSIKTTMMKTNLNDVDKIIETAIKYGCKTVKFNCVREDGRAKLNDGIVINSSEYIGMIKKIEIAKQEYQDKIKIKAPLNTFCEEEYNYIADLGFGCFAGKETLCIDPLGNVRPCSHFPKEFICGNIKEELLYNIWHNSSVLQTFRHLSGNNDCNNCEKYDKCRAGCRYRAFLNDGINSVDPFCYKGKI